MTKIKVIIDRETCIGCGAAPALCSEVFELIDDGKNAIVEKYRVNDNPAEGVVPAELEECVKRAAEGCPVNAIRYEVTE